MAKQIVSSTLLSLILLTTPIISNSESHGSQFTAFGDKGTLIAEGLGRVTMTPVARWRAPAKASQEAAFAVNNDGDKDGKKDGDKEKDKCKDKGKDKGNDKDKDKGKDKCRGGGEAVNKAPIVNAGPNQTIALPSSASLSGTVVGDGLPTGTLTTTWSEVSGPGTVIFSDERALNSVATFSAPGVYILRLTASDGLLHASADVRITVNPAVYYVSVLAGNDSNPGTSAEPWKSIQKAANTAETGATVIVTSGTYNERVQITRSGSPGAPITYRAQGTVIMQGFTVGFTIQVSYVRIIGFEITNSLTNRPDSVGVFIFGAHNEVSNCYIHDILNEEGVVVHGGADRNAASVNNNLVKNNTIVRARIAGVDVEGQNNIVERNDISHTLQNPPGSVAISGADADGIRFFGTGNIIRKNYLHDIHLTDAGNHGCFEGQGPDRCPHSDVFQTFGPASNIIIEDNIAHWTDDGLSGQVAGVNPQWAEIEATPGLDVTNLIFRNNVFTHETNKFGPMNFDDSEGGLIDNIAIVNNTFVRVNGPGSGTLPPGVGESCILLNGVHGLLRNVTIKNNAFYDCGSSTFGYVNVLGLTANVDYNAVYMSSGPAPAGGPRPNDVWMVDPKFVNFAAKDFHLQAQSPLIDAGATLAEVSDDLDGNPRPQHHKYDIGAYEFVFGRAH